jgi:hypothetical protein
VDCASVKYSDHAILQMFKRGIDTFEVEIVIKQGEIIKSYLDDRPYPSFLILGYSEEKAIHLVIAKNVQDEECIVVTAYIPDPTIWMEDFKIRR